MSDETVITVLPRYERMRVAVRECVTVDEAKDMRDKAEALAYYARQRDDIELETWVSEIRLRACIRIGEISRELETGHKVGRGSEVQIPSGGKLKAEALADAGISTSTAARYEELAGGREEQGQAAAKAAADAYFARSAEVQEPPTMDALRGAIREALVQTFGPPPERKPRQKPEEPDPAAEVFDLFCAAIHTIAKTPEEYHAGLADRAEPNLAQYHLGLARRALRLTGSFIKGLEGSLLDAGLPDKKPSLLEAWDRASEEERQTLLRNAGITPTTKPEPHRPTLLEAVERHFDKPGAREQYLKVKRIDKRAWPIWDKAAVVDELITAVLEKLPFADQDDDVIDVLGGRECLKPFITRTTGFRQR